MLTGLRWKLSYTDILLLFFLLVSASDTYVYSLDEHNWSFSSLLSTTWYTEMD